MGKKVSTFFKMNHIMPKKSVYCLYFMVQDCTRYFWLIFMVKIFSFWMVSLKFKEKNDILFVFDRGGIEPRQGVVRPNHFSDDILYNLVKYCILF